MLLKLPQAQITVYPSIIERVNRYIPTGFRIHIFEWQNEGLYLNYHAEHVRPIIIKNRYLHVSSETA